MNGEIIAKAGDIIRQDVAGQKYCTLSLIDTDGYPVASTITASKAGGIDWITFCTGLSSPKVERIRNDSRAAVCYNSFEYSITLIGRIEIVTDPGTKLEMWYEGLEDHFSGPEDPDFCVLYFRTERYNLFVDWQEVRGTLS